MRKKTSGSRRGFAIACVVAVTTLGLVGAAPARAENDFANGFEDQLGRIVAHQAVSLGFLLLSGGAHHQAVRYGVRHEPYRGWTHADPYRYRPAYRHKRRARRHYRPPRRVYRHFGHEHDDYDAYEDCNEGRAVYERRFRFYEDGRGVEFERRTRY